MWSFQGKIFRKGRISEENTPRTGLPAPIFVYAGHNASRLGPSQMNMSDLRDTVLRRPQVRSKGVRSNDGERFFQPIMEASVRWNGSGTQLDVQTARTSRLSGRPDAA